MISVTLPPHKFRSCRATNNSQLRLASVRVVEAVCLWRNDIDMQAARANPAPPSAPPGRGEHAPANAHEEEAAGTLSQHQQIENVGIGGASGVDGASSPRRPLGENDRSEDLDDGDEAALFLDPPQERNNHGPKGSSRISEVARKQTAKTAGGGGGSGSGGGGGSIPGRNNPVGGKSGGGRVSKGRWVATMMVPGRKLWDSSPAMMSQHKRFRRSRQNPKIARDQVCR